MQDLEKAARKWAWGLAEGANAALKAKAIADEDTFLEAVKAIQREAIKSVRTDYEEVLSDHRRLVRELDIALNGDGAAKQAGLCDIVAQVRSMERESGVAGPNEQPKPARDGVESIERLLNGHKLLHHFIRDSDCQLPLVDLLTPQGDASISRGMEETAALAEAIAAMQEAEQ